MATKHNVNSLDRDRPAGYDDWEDHGECVELKEFTVFEQNTDTFTGLYDANGQPLHRQRPRIGFLTWSK